MKKPHQEDEGSSTLRMVEQREFSPINQFNFRRFIMAGISHYRFKHLIFIFNCSVISSVYSQNSYFIQKINPPSSLYVSERNTMNDRQNTKANPRNWAILLSLGYFKLLGESGPGMSFDLGYRFRKNYLGFVYSGMSFNKSWRELGTIEGLGFHYAYDTPWPLPYLSFSFGFNIGYWRDYKEVQFINAYGYDDYKTVKDKSLFGGPTLESKIGYKHVFITIRYSLLLGTGVDNCINTGLQFIY